MNKKVLLNRVFEWGRKFSLKEINGDEFRNFYMKLWDSVIRKGKLFTKEEHDILDELHSDCDCLNHPDERICLSEEDLRRIVQEKMKNLFGGNIK